jgi:hypothetical protein
VSTHDDLHGEPQLALSGDLLGTIGLVLSGQGLAAGCVLALAVLGGWLAWSLVAVMVLGGLTLCALTGKLRPRR